MSDVYKNLSNASSGKELVDLINGLGLETIIAELSGIEAATIVERFKADADFNNFVGEVTTNAALVPAAPVPVSSLVSVPGSDIDFSRMVSAANGAELVGLFGNGDLATITAGLSPEQIEQVVQKFGADDDFNAWLTTVAPPPPPAGPGADVPPPSPTQLLNEDGEIMMEDGSGNLVVEPRDVLDLLGLDPVAFVPPPLPAGEELDKLVDQAQNSGQGPLIKDSKGQLLNQYGEVMVLDSGGKLAPAPREVPVGMLPNGDGSFMPDPDWMPLNPLPEEGYFDPRERPPEEGYFDPEGGEYNVDIVGQYSEPPLAHQNWA